LFLEQLNVGTDAFCGVNRDVVEDGGQWLDYVLLEQSEEVHEEFRGRLLPELGAEQAAAGEQGCHDVEPLAAFGLDQMALAFGSPGAAVEMHRREAGFVDIGQHEVPVGGSLKQGVDLYGCTPEGRLVATFSNECRVRFHTSLDDLSVAAMVLR